MFSWADNTAVEENSEQFAALNHILDKVFLMKRAKPDFPVLVHCSAGIGRTGTFLAICLMIEALKELQSLKLAQGLIETDEEVKEDEVTRELLEPRVSIFGTVRRLREQRCYMVKKQS